MVERNKEVETREYNRILNVKWLHCEYQSSPEYNLHFEILEILPSLTPGLLEYALDVTT